LGRRFFSASAGTDLSHHYAGSCVARVRNKRVGLVSKRPKKKGEKLGKWRKYEKEIRLSVLYYTPLAWEVSVSVE
jgi:hypothetical protein